MSGESFAALRKHRSADLRNLADEHFKHDLKESDRDLLQTAGKKFGTYAAIGSVLGLGLGALLALRIRRSRMRMFQAFRATEKPTHVQFADGRTEAIPDVTPMLAPSRFGDILTYTFFGFGGMFIFGELGGLAGAYSAKRTIASDPDASQRIDKAFRGFQADLLRRQAESLESGKEKAFNF